MKSVPNGAPAFTGSERGLTRKQAAELLSYAPATLANLATLNQGPPFRKHRGRVIYLESELVAWLKSLPTGGGRAAPGRSLGLSRSGRA
jgi:hypothetical protein